MDTTLSRSGKTPTQKAVTGRIFFLDLGGGRVLSANPDGSDLRTIVVEDRKFPDGLVADIAAGHLYWTNMGNFKENDGSILRSDLDGKNVTTIVPPGGVFTPKQLQIEKKTGKLYWCDGEGNLAATLRGWRLLSDLERFQIEMVSKYTSLSCRYLTASLRLGLSL